MLSNQFTISCKIFFPYGSFSAHWCLYPKCIIVLSWIHRQTASVLDFLAGMPYLSFFGKPGVLVKLGPTCMQLETVVQLI